MSTATTNYAIRFIPPGTKLPYAGGVYATRDSVNSPILAANLNTGGANQKVSEIIVLHWYQRIRNSNNPWTSLIQWQLEAVKGGANTYHITQPTDPNIHIGPVLSGFGLDPTGVQVVLTTSMTEFAFTQVDPANNIFMSVPFWIHFYKCTPSVWYPRPWLMTECLHRSIKLGRVTMSML